MLKRYCNIAVIAFNYKTVIMSIKCSKILFQGLIALHKTTSNTGTYFFQVKFKI